MYTHNRDESVTWHCTHPGCDYSCRKLPKIPIWEHLLKKHDDVSSTFEGGSKVGGPGLGGIGEAGAAMRPPALYSCEQCTYRTYLKTKFTHHSVTHEGGTKVVRSYFCKQPECNYVATSLYCLRKHELVAHDINTKIWTCEICAASNINKSFVTNSHLTAHKKIHSGTVKPRNRATYACTQPDCTFVAKSVSTLRTHENKAHNMNTKTFRCDQCNHAFVTNGLLNVHKEKVHGYASAKIRKI
jgi:hypothetical protein